jgi:hypothetical protein
LSDAFTILSPDGAETISKDDKHKRGHSEESNRFRIGVFTFAVLQALRLIVIFILFLSIYEQKICQPFIAVAFYCELFILLAF